MVGWPLSFRGKKEDVHALEKRIKNGENPCLFYFSARFFSGFWLGWKEEEKMEAFFPKKGLPLQHKRHFFLRWEK